MKEGKEKKISGKIRVQWLGETRLKVLAASLLCALGLILSDPLQLPDYLSVSSAGPPFSSCPRIVTQHILPRPGCQ